LATATRFAEEGMKVVLADIQRDAMEAAVSSPKEAGHDVIADAGMAPVAGMMDNQLVTGFGG
jgi:H2-forming N5,N10-methylenetetrahydromethanopterin dehydrogenase-like enzyme